MGTRLEPLFSNKGGVGVKIQQQQRQTPPGNNENMSISNGLSESDRKKTKKNIFNQFLYNFVCVSRAKGYMGRNNKDVFCEQIKGDY